MTLRALFAVAAGRLRAERKTFLYACAAAAVAGFAPSRELAVPIFFCSALGIAAALLQTPGRHPDLDLCEAGAPLYGRELARGKASAACVVAVVASVAYCTPALTSGIAGAASTLIAAVAAAIASSLIALSASVREEPSRSLYVALAAITSACAFAIAQWTHSLPGEIAFCALAGFFALRQYGETLARYDPL